MTLISTLFPSGGGGVPYPSGVPVIDAIGDIISESPGALGRDYLKAFTPRADVTVDKVWWWRHVATAANVYVGVYDNSGNLLSDCAVDADTTTGVHEVNSTNFDLTAGSLYYLAINQSAKVFGCDTTLATDEVLSFQLTVGSREDLGLYSGGTAPPGARSWGAPYKARANAALLDPITMSGFTTHTLIISMGIVPT